MEGIAIVTIANHDAGFEEGGCAVRACCITVEDKGIGALYPTCNADDVVRPVFRGLFRRWAEPFAVCARAWQVSYQWIGVKVIASLIELGDGFFILTTTDVREFSDILSGPVAKVGA